MVVGRDCRASDRLFSITNCYAALILKMSILRYIYVAMIYFGEIELFLERCSAVRHAMCVRACIHVRVCLYT